jgi:hypothetical protein
MGLMKGTSWLYGLDPITSFLTRMKSRKSNIRRHEKETPPSRIRGSKGLPTHRAIPRAPKTNNPQELDGAAPTVIHVAVPLDTADRLEASKIYRYPEGDAHRPSPMPRRGSSSHCLSPLDVDAIWYLHFICPSTFN